MWKALFGMTQRLLLGSCKLIWTDGQKVKVAEKTGWGNCLVALLGRRRPGEWAQFCLKQYVPERVHEVDLLGADALIAWSVLWFPLSCHGSLQAAGALMVFKCLTHAHTILIGLVLSLREKEEKQETRALIHLQRRQWQHTLVFSPGKSRGRRSLVGCSPWGREESDTTSLSLSLFTFMHWRRRWQPTLVFLPGESQGQRSLVGFHLWGHTESDTTEAT